MRANATKAKLKAGETVFGCFTRTPDPSLTEFLALQGWDFLVFDGEHGTLQPRECEDMVRAAEVRGVTPIVRVTANEPPIILRFLDTGAAGVHVPWVNSAAEAEAAVRAVKYHPRGIRGLGGVRATDYGQTMSYGDYIQRANAETMVVLHIETGQAAEHIEEIIAVEDVDVVFIGPTDLSHSLGVAGQTNHPAVQAAMQRVVEATANSSVALGILVKDAESAHQWQERGARYIVITLEGLLGPACRRYLQAARPQ